MQVSSHRGANNSASLRRGPLVYSLAMEEEWTAVDKGSRPGFESYEVTSPTAWNYALAIDESNPEKSVETIKRPGAANPFETGKSSLVLRAKAQRLDSWKLRDDGLVPLDPPFSPVSSDAPVETIELAPFGSQMLRITDFPVIGEPTVPHRQWTDKFASGVVDDLGDLPWRLSSRWTAQSCPRLKRNRRTVVVRRLVVRGRSASGRRRRCGTHFPCHLAVDRRRQLQGLLRRHRRVRWRSADWERQTTNGFRSPASRLRFLPRIPIECELKRAGPKFASGLMTRRSRCCKCVTIRSRLVRLAYGLTPIGRHSGN